MEVLLIKSNIEIFKMRKHGNITCKQSPGFKADPNIETLNTEKGNVGLRSRVLS
jgi:hypothetical protein